MSDPIERPFPDQFQTDRLLIRRPRAGDGVGLYAALSDSLAELQPWMPWAHDPISAESCELNVLRACDDFDARRDLRLPLYLRSDPATLVGSSGLHRIDWDVPRFEIGYWLRTPYTGQGYATEAVRGVAAFAFRELGASRLEIWCDERNTASAAVARRVGFRHEATFRDRARGVHGELVTDLVFGLLRDEAGDALGIGVEVP